MQPETGPPRQRRCLVTGAASGIGRAVALLFASEGYAVLGVDIDGAGLTETAVCAEGEPGRLLTHIADVSDEAACAAAVAAAVAGEEGLDALVNVAGVMTRGAATIETTSLEEWERVFASNVRSVFLLAKHAVPELRRRCGGVIVNTASVHAFASYPGYAPYAASKGAIVALTRQMAIDLASDGIRVVAVAPGGVDTPMSRAAIAESGTTMEEAGWTRDPRELGWLGSPLDVAQVILWLASDSALLINGATVLADGGLLTRIP